MGLIVAEQLGKDYPVGEIVVKALHDVSLTIESASFVSFIRLCYSKWMPGRVIY